TTGRGGVCSAEGSPPGTVTKAPTAGGTPCWRCSRENRATGPGGRWKPRCTGARYWSRRRATMRIDNSEQQPSSSPPPQPTPANGVVARRAEELFGEQARAVHCRTDRLFAGLLAVQWVAAVVVALYLSPRAWAGLSSSIHLHVWAALILGG